MEMERRTQRHSQCGPKVTARAIQYEVLGAVGLLALVLAIFVAFHVSHERPNAALTSEQEYGRSLYNLHCASCHEDAPQGLKQTPPTLHAISTTNRLPSGDEATDETIRNVIRKGKLTMPSFNGRLTERQMAAIIAYLRAGIR